MFCPKCGTSNIDDAKYCIKCGSAISANTEIANQKKNTRTGNIVIISACIVAILILFQVFTSTNSKDKNSSSSITDKESTSEAKESSNTDYSDEVKKLIVGTTWTIDLLENYYIDIHFGVAYTDDCIEVTHHSGVEPLEYQGRFSVHDGIIEFEGRTTQEYTYEYVLPSGTVRLYYNGMPLTEMDDQYYATNILHAFDPQ